LAAIVGNDSPLIPTGGKWTNAGMVIGPKRSASWRILDAKYFGVAQRRRRVFVVASARDGFDPSEVLFERKSMFGYSAPGNPPQARVGRIFPCLTRKGGGSLREEEGYVVEPGGGVRRLTPREFERLQGFPDNYTAIPGGADGPRYKSLGNSMAVPVMRWIGQRIKNHLELR